jgi:hypothetical protein
MISEDYRGHNIVFIVGSPRSGTTWLQRLLASHPGVRTGQETDLFDVYVGPQLRAWHRDLDQELSGRGGVGLAGYLREEEFLSLLREYMNRLLEPMVGELKPGELFVEKTPSHALFIPEIMELLPESRIIHILRDARDVVASLLAASRSWGSHWAPQGAARASGMWVRHVEAVRKAALGLKKDRFHEVRYEELHASTPETFKGVCEFLELQWDEEGIEKAVEENTPEKAKKQGGTRIPMGGEFARREGLYVREPEGFVRKALPGAWKRDLSLAEKICVWAFARKTMNEAGYRWVFPW